MKIWLFVLGLLTTLNVMSQNDRQKEFQVRVGYGVAAYASATELRYDLGGAQITWKDTSGAVAKYIPIELRYEFHPRFNAGIDMKFGSYLYDPKENNAGKSNAFVSIGIGLEVNIINRENFRWYGGLGFNSTRLDITEKHGTGLLSYTETSSWSGGGFKMNSGVLIYFGSSRLGLNTNLGFDSHNLKLQDIKRNDSNLNISKLSGNLQLAGIDWTLGLVLRLY